MNTKKILRKRGLNDAAIQKHQYRSVPVTGVDNIVKTLLSYNMDLKGVPGFYMLDGKWKVNFTPALAGISYSSDEPRRLHSGIPDQVK